MEIKEAKLKAARYCAYQERAPFDVEEKLKSFDLNPQQIKEILAELTEDGFINETRFTSIFVKSKFRNNKWGKIKIKQHLSLKKLPQDVIVSGLKEIPDEEYLSMIRMLVEQKTIHLNESDTFISNHKVASYLVQKGFEPELVWKYLKE